MKVFRSILAVLSLSTLVTAVIFMFGEVGIWSVPYLIVHSVAFVLSLPIVVFLCKLFLKNKSASVGIVFAVIGFVLLYYVLAPVLLIAALIRYIVRIFVSPKAKESDDEISDEESRETYLTSASKAIDKILDDNNTELIVLDDGRQVTKFKQVAVITLEETVYALLSPATTKEDEEKAVAYAYAIENYPGTETLSLVPVKSRARYRAVFEAYESLLAKQ